MSAQHSPGAVPALGLCVRCVHDRQAPGEGGLCAACRRDVEREYAGATAEVAL